MNTTEIFDKYFRGICHATNVAGEDLGAVRLGLQMALDEQYERFEGVRNEVVYLEGLVGEQRTNIARLQGLEDRLLAWLDEHRSDLPIMLADDYDQYLADVIVEVLNQQHVTIRTQHEALAAQKEAIGRMRQEQPQPPIKLYQNGNGQVVAQTADSAASRNGLVIVLPDAVVADPTVPADWPHGEALYVELHRLAANGIGPSKSRWDDERAAGMPKADDVIAKTGLRWFNVLKAAGLMSPTKQPWRTQATEAAPDGDGTFRA